MIAFRVGLSAARHDFIDRPCMPCSPVSRLFIRVGLSAAPPIRHVASSAAQKRPHCTSEVARRTLRRPFGAAETATCQIGGRPRRLCAKKGGRECYVTETPVGDGRRHAKEGSRRHGGGGSRGQVSSKTRTMRSCGHNLHRWPRYSHVLSNNPSCAPAMAIALI